MNGPDIQTLTSYFRLMNTNGAAQVYHAALETGILAALDDGGKSTQQVAEACGHQEQPTALLLEALRAMRVVERDGSTLR